MTDPRTIFAMDHVADVALKGQVDASVFRTPVRMQIGTPVADIMRSSPQALERQFLLGETVDVLDPASQNPTCRSETSGYVGFTSQAALAEHVPASHIVHAPASFLFDADDFKTRHPRWISMGSLLTVTDETTRFFKTHTGQFVPKRHVRDISFADPDPVASLAGLVGVPYLWGGNSAAGIDCSGLVQMMMRLVGSSCPGDSDQQAGALGDALAMDAPVQRGDLWFWKGHVAISWDENTLIHANAHHMSVQFEGLTDAIKRIKDQGDGPVTARRRVF